MRARSSLAPIALALASALAAQQRTPLFGSVVDAKGAAIAGATVQLAHVPAGCEGEVAADAPTATSDERGRFRADVWPCTQYRAWAIGPERDGKRAVSGVAWTSASEVLELRAVTDVMRCKVRLGGLDAWAHRAPFRVRVLPECTELPGLVANLLDGEAELPALPNGWVLYELLDRDGRVLHDGLMGAPRNEPRQLRVPPPQKVPLVVVDEGGAPVAGAEVRLLFDSGRSDGSGLLPGPCQRTTWSTLGVTGTDGRFVAEIAAEQSSLVKWEGRMLLFFVRKAGRASTGSGWASNRVFFDWIVQPTREAKELRCTLHPAQPLRGRVLAGAKPLAGAAITSRLAMRITNGGSPWSRSELTWRNTTSDDGRFEIEDAPLAAQNASFALEIAPETVVGEPLLRQVPRRAIVLHDTATRPVGEYTIDVAACRPLSLRIFADAKGPPKNCEVLFLTHGNHASIIDGFTPRAVPDSAGRLHVLLQPGPWTVFVRDETSMASAEVDSTKTATLTLQLEPMPAMHAHVVDEQGEPVPGVRPWLQGMTLAADGGAPLTALANAMNRRWITRAATDAHGEVSVRFLPMKGSSYEVRFGAPDRKSGRFVLEPNTEPATIVVH